MHIYRESHRAALLIRAQATTMGATKQDLAPGDAIRRRAEDDAAAGRYTDAGPLATTAGEAWTRAGDAATARLKTVSPDTSKLSVGVTGQLGDTASSANRPPPGVTETRPDTTSGSSGGAEDVRTVIAAYIAAVNSRQMSEMRRIWPTMPDDAAHNWQALFKEATDLSVKLVSTDDPAVNGSHAQANFSYVITGFVPSQGAIPPKTFQFRAKLERDRWGWRIVSMDARK